jgi:hypothetical protein
MQTSLAGYLQEVVDEGIRTGAVTENQFKRRTPHFLSL